MAERTKQPAIKITMLAGTEIIGNVSYKKGMSFFVDGSPEALARFESEPNRYKIDAADSGTPNQKCLVEQLADGLFPDDPAPSPHASPVAAGDAVWHDVSDQFEIPAGLDLVVEKKESGYTRFRLNGDITGKTLKNQKRIKRFVGDIIDAHNDTTK